MATRIVAGSRGRIGEPGNHATNAAIARSAASPHKTGVCSAPSASAESGMASANSTRLALPCERIARDGRGGIVGERRESLRELSSRVRAKKAYADARAPGEATVASA